MFVRSKTIKGKQYGYLVENSWEKGKVHQRTKKYLGRIIPIGAQEAVRSEVDFNQPFPQVMDDLISHMLTRVGFKNGQHPTGVTVSGSRIRHAKRKIVLAINDRYVYDDLLAELVSLSSENEVSGERLASLFSDAGLAIHPDDFVKLYKCLHH